MFGRLIGFVVCAIGLILPHRLRIWFSELLGWIIQGMYFAYAGLINYLLRELRKESTAKPEADE